jgi:two-component system response regulator FixJ
MVFGQREMRAQDYTVCLIDPDEAVHDALSTLLRTSGTRVKCFSSAEAFLDSGVTLDAPTGCLLAEASLPGMGCLAFLRRLQAISIDVPVIVLTSTSERRIAEQALKAGALKVIEKPLVSDRILEHLFPTSCACEKPESNGLSSAVAQGACNCNSLTYK